MIDVKEALRADGNQSVDDDTDRRPQRKYDDPPDGTHLCEVSKIEIQENPWQEGLIQLNVRLWLPEVRRSTFAKIKLNRFASGKQREFHEGQLKNLGFSGVFVDVPDELDAIKGMVVEAGFETSEWNGKPRQQVFFRGVKGVGDRTEADDRRPEPAPVDLSEFQQTFGVEDVH